MKKVFCFNNCACRVFRTNLVLVWFQCCPRYFSRKKGISGTFLSLGLRPRLQKNFPRFPFFYFSTLDNTSIRRGQICPRTWQHNYRNKILYLKCVKHFIMWEKPVPKVVFSIPKKVKNLTNWIFRQKLFVLLTNLSLINHFSNIFWNFW